MQKRIYLSSPTIHEEEKQFVQEAFDTNWVAPLGPNVNAFEKEIAEYTDRGYAAAVSSGTATIHLAMPMRYICMIPIHLRASRSRSKLVANLYPTMSFVIIYNAIESLFVNKYQIWMLILWSVADIQRVWRIRVICY